MNQRNLVQRLAAPFAFALITLLPACQKCETCSYTYSNGKETYTFPETCGDKNKRDAQRHACETMAAMAGTTCVCGKSN